MEPKEQQLIEKILKLFMRFGIKSLTMDDIARELGISKKTLYLFFEDKNQIVSKCLTYQFEQDKKLVEGNVQNSANAIEEMLNVSRCVNENLKNIHPSVLYDLKKYHAEAFQLVSEYKISYVLETLLRNLYRGIEEGLYRKNIDVNIIARIYVGRLELVLDQELFPSDRFAFMDIYYQLMNYHLHAIVSPKGLKLIEKIFNTDK